jgi:hypothetical protein
MLVVFKQRRLVSEFFPSQTGDSIKHVGGGNAAATEFPANADVFHVVRSDPCITRTMCQLTN